MADTQLNWVMFFTAVFILFCFVALPFAGGLTAMQLLQINDFLGLFGVVGVGSSFLMVLIPTFALMIAAASVIGLQVPETTAHVLLFNLVAGSVIISVEAIYLLNLSGVGFLPRMGIGFFLIFFGAAVLVALGLGAVLGQRQHTLSHSVPPNSDPNYAPPLVSEPRLNNLANTAPVQHPAPISSRPVPLTQSTRLNQSTTIRPAYLLDLKTLQRYMLNNVETRIGRGTANTILIDDPTVSRDHIAVVWKEGHFRLYVNPGREATVNRQRIQDAVNLVNQDIIQIGDTRLRFLISYTS